MTIAAAKAELEIVLPMFEKSWAAYKEKRAELEPLEKEFVTWSRRRDDLEAFIKLAEDKPL